VVGIDWSLQRRTPRLAPWRCQQTECSAVQNFAVTPAYRDFSVQLLLLTPLV
jgi:hypothetical protein